MQLGSQEKRENRTEALFKEIIGDNFPNLIKTSTHRFKKLSKIQAGQIQRKLQQKNIIVKLLKIRARDNCRFLHYWEVVKISNFNCNKLKKYMTSLGQGWVKVFCKRQDNKYFRIHGPHIWSLLHSFHFFITLKKYKNPGQCASVGQIIVLHIKGLQL